MAEEIPKSPENPESEKRQAAAEDMSNLAGLAASELEDALGPAAKKYVSKCLVCGHHHPEDLDAHRYPFEHVTLEDVEMWRKSGDSEQAIMSRIAGRGMAE